MYGFAICLIVFEHCAVTGGPFSALRARRQPACRRAAAAHFMMMWVWPLARPRCNQPVIFSFAVIVVARYAVARAEPACVGRKSTRFPLSASFRKNRLDFWVNITISVSVPSTKGRTSRGVVKVGRDAVPAGVA